MTIKKNDDILPSARRLRRDMTRHERKLWYLFLRTYPIKVYRQRIVGSYIVDFYCASAKLIIEIDGSQHYDAQGQAYDAARSKYFQALGLRVVRFSNADIHSRFSSVCESIHMLIQAPTT